MRDTRPTNQPHREYSELWFRDMLSIIAAHLAYYAYLDSDFHSSYLRRRAHCLDNVPTPVAEPRCPPSVVLNHLAFL